MKQYSYRGYQIREGFGDRWFVMALDSRDTWQLVSQTTSELKATQTIDDLVLLALAEIAPRG